LATSSESEDDGEIRETYAKMFRQDLRKHPHLIIFALVLSQHCSDAGMSARHLPGSRHRYDHPRSGHFPEPSHLYQTYRYVSEACPSSAIPFCNFEEMVERLITLGWIKGVQGAYDAEGTQRDEILGYDLECGTGKRREDYITWLTSVPGPAGRTLSRVVHTEMEHGVGTAS
jgi:hypothetical protein